MKILVPGRLKKTTAVCHECECVYEGSENEFTIRYDYGVGKVFYCSCPCCGMDNCFLESELKWEDR